MTPILARPLKGQESPHTGVDWLGSAGKWGNPGKGRAQQEALSDWAAGCFGIEHRVLDGLGGGGEVKVNFKAISLSPWGCSQAALFYYTPGSQPWVPVY